MTNTPKVFYKKDLNLVRNLSVVCHVVVKEKEEVMTQTNYVLERCINNDGVWEHYTTMANFELEDAMAQFYYWQGKQPNYQFRMHKATKELVLPEGKA